MDLSDVVVGGGLEGHGGIDGFGFLGKGSSTGFDGFGDIGCTGDEDSCGGSGSTDKAGVCIGGVLGIFEIICLDWSHL